jgi:CrcB protein
MSIPIFIAVAAGGAVGSLGRYFAMILAARWLGGEFPFATLTVNVLGSFALGCLAELMALAWSASEETRAFLTVGFLGAFTTFSAFSMDTFLLLDRGQFSAAVAYALASVILWVAGFWVGLVLLRQLLG